MECTAKSKRSGVKCKGQAVTGSSKCRMHGGKSPAGMASPRYRHGRYSKVLPTRLSARYRQATHDSQLLELREDIALLDARITDVLSRVDTGESGELWRAARRACLEFIAARTNVARARSWLERLDQITSRGFADSEAWTEISKLLDQKVRLVESERRRLIEQQLTITAEQATYLFEAIFKAVTKFVSDRETRAAIQEEFQRLVDRHI